LFFTASPGFGAIIAEQSHNVEIHNQEAIDAMHRAKNDAIRMKECLLRAISGNWERSWSRLATRRNAGSITNDRIERFYRVASGGAYCGKVSGAGGGGFMIFLVDVKNKLRVVDALTSHQGGTWFGSFHGNGVESWRLP